MADYLAAWVTCLVCAGASSWIHGVAGQRLAGQFLAGQPVLEPDSQDSCILSFVVPRDKMKSSCDTNPQVTRQMNSMELKINMYRQQVADLQTELDKHRRAYSQQLDHLQSQVQSLGQRLDTRGLDSHKRNPVENDHDQLTEDIPISAKEKASSPKKKRGTSGDQRDAEIQYTELPSTIKSLIQSELSGLFDNFTSRFEAFVREKFLVYDQMFQSLSRISGNSIPQNLNVLSLLTQSNSPGDAPEGDKQPLKNTLDKRNPASVGNVPGKAEDSGGQSLIRDMINDNQIDAEDQLAPTRGLSDDSVKEPHPALPILEDQSNDEMFSGDNPENNDTSAPLEYRLYQNQDGNANGTFSRITNAASDEGDSSFEFKFKMWEVKWMGVVDDKIMEVEARLRDHISVTIATPLAEVIRAVEKVKAEFEEKISFLDERFETAQTDAQMQIRDAEQSARTVNQQLQLLVKDFDTTASKLDKVKHLELRVNEIWHNMTVENKASVVSAQEFDEYSKRVRKVERLVAVYQQSCDHYRNETKHEYREVRESVEKESTAIRTLSKSLQTNLESMVSSELARLNTSNHAKSQEMNDQIRAHEDSLLLLQIDMENVEKALQARPKLNERDFNELQDLVHQLTTKQRDLRKKLEQIEQVQANITDNVSNVTSDVLALKTEVKLNADEWMPLNFDFDSSRTECFGNQYVRRTKYSRVRLVGVVLCSPTRYKIFLASSLHGSFQNIGDGNGMGEDHCEFVGGRKADPVKLSPFKPSFGAVQGYARSHWGQEPTLSLLNAIKPSPLWYECGIQIP